MDSFRFRPVLLTIVFPLFLFLATSSAFATDVIYLNRCASGCTVQPGADNAVTHRSSIPQSTSSLPAFSYGDAKFVATEGCLRKAFARYDVLVTPTDPGSMPRREIMLAGLPQNLGLPAGTRAIAPIYLQPRDNAIVFVFAAELLGDFDKMCSAAAQQVGYLYALDTELHCPDFMSSSSGCGLKTFTDFAAPCGETTPRTCINGSSTQNSAAQLTIVPGLGDRIFLSDFESASPSP